MIYFYIAFLCACGSLFLMSIYRPGFRPFDHCARFFFTYTIVTNEIINSGHNSYAVDMEIDVEASPIDNQPSLRVGEDVESMDEFLDEDEEDLRDEDEFGADEDVIRS